MESVSLLFYKEDNVCWWWNRWWWWWLSDSHNVGWPIPDVWGADQWRATIWDKTVLQNGVGSVWANFRHSPSDMVPPAPFVITDRGPAALCCRDLSRATLNTVFFVIYRNFVSFRNVDICSLYLVCIKCWTLFGSKSTRLRRVSYCAYFTRLVHNCLQNVRHKLILIQENWMIIPQRRNSAWGQVCLSFSSAED